MQIKKKLNNKPKISVVIPTYNGASTLTATVDSLFKQSISLSDYEVIAINNNSTDSTEEVLKTLKQKYPEFKYFFQPIQGVAPTRNKGAQLAKADIILFLDDDMIVSKELLAQHIKSREKHFGTVLGYFETDWKQKKDKFLDFLEESGHQNVFNFKDGDIVSYKYFYTGNISVQREYFEKVGGFDENFPGPGVEDIDLGYRMYCYGDRIMFNKKASSLHLYYPDLKTFKSKKYKIGNPLSYFLEKFPNMKRQFVITPKYKYAVFFVHMAEFILDPIVMRLPEKFIKKYQYLYLNNTIMARLVAGYFHYLPKFKKRSELLKL